MSSYNCEIKEQPAQPTMSIRTRASLEKLPEVIGQSAHAIIQYLGEIGEQPESVLYVAYFNLEMSDLDVEIGFPVSKKLPGRGDIQPGEIPGGKVATCMYTGPYSEMRPAYEALMRLVNEKGQVPTGISYEMYYNSPMEVSLEDLKTLILLPLKK
ncbi:AraC family transcriptional regulator [Methanocella sp. CWC-04]|uniref:AraC family transcriptional regulator n=1 Tax=Methanooceanicella nereidis TaxID=2052831 RepID=A0AAP2W7Z9_9EURY|nr:GyrI-like domain-containing protein [Methanocella sp. CWC-04]MCD1295769.1 AraC family transcriptional regulator [Methanocella sp. CWC-04]